jgi:uncharacterized phage protein gp47/JayE
MYGLTNDGFVKKDLQTIKTEIEQSLKSAFGQTIDLSESSVFGQIVGLNSIREANIWDLAEETYNSQSPDGATGINLDRVNALVNIQRLPSIATTAQGLLTGINGTVITIDSEVSQVTTNLAYALIEAVTLNTSNCIDFTFNVGTVIDSTNYTITIAGTPFTYNSGTDATNLSIINGLEALFNLSGYTFIDNLNGSAKINVDDYITEFAFSIDTNLNIVTVSRNGQFVCTETGENPLPAQTLNIIDTPVSGWTAVNNLLSGTTGTEQETDQDFRERRRSAQRAVGRGTDEALKGRLLVVDNVTSVLVISNRESTVDVDSRPGKSFEAIVLGGSDSNIADEIWLTQPAGIESYGNTSIVVKDSQNVDQTILFSRPEPVYTWIEIALTLYDEEIFPTNGTDKIKDSIVVFSDTEYDIGIDVLRQRLYKPVFETSGISSATIKLGTSLDPGTPPGSYTEVDISINSREIASIDKARMTIGVV